MEMCLYRFDVLLRPCCHVLICCVVTYFHSTKHFLSFFYLLGERTNTQYFQYFSCSSFLTQIAMNLQEAVEKGDLERVRLLLGQGIDKDEADSNTWTALFNAAWAGHLPIVQYLVEQGAEMDKATNSGTTPLIMASALGHLDVVRYLWSKGQTGTRPILSTSLHSTVLLWKVIWRSQYC